MAKIELKGFFVSITPALRVGQNDTLLQKFVFKVPGYTDSFGDKKGQDEYWEIQVFGDSVAKHNLTADLEEKKAKLTVFINSKYIAGKAAENPKDAPKPDMYIINATLHEFQTFN